MKVYYIFILCLGLMSCNKKEFLDERPRSDLFVPTTLEDFQALLDNDIVISLTPVLGELSADNFYLLQSSWSSLSTKERNAYTWEKDTYGGEGKVVDWNTPYEQVLIANVVLEGLKNVARTADNWQKWNTVRGGALFIRAYAFYNLAQVFALPYNAATANTDLGIPLKLSPNVDEKVQRSTLEQTYSQILNDLLEAKTLLPDTLSSLRIRPNKPAAFAQLARVYLSMRQYDKAGANADSSLQLYRALIDYNTRDANSSRPFDKLNIETMYQSKFVETNVLKGILGAGLVDTNLYNSYAPNDLRRSLFFYTNPFGKLAFKGSYTGLITAFTGLATDETYLIRAECKARANDVTGAMNDLNTLLQQRWKSGTFAPFTATTWQEALDTILIQRRKELPCRGLRWTDIRRLNLETRGIKPVRFINNLPYILPVNSPRYALPIPPDAEQLGNYIQNERE
ncbi:MAG TPA: RagB/SusD family nutrient uptake outer membrane protein [Niastella sp.]